MRVIDPLFLSFAELLPISSKIIKIFTIKKAEELPEEVDLTVSEKND